MIGVALLLAAVLSKPECAGVTLYHGSRARCQPEPMLLRPCAAVRACRDASVCAVTVTGKLAASRFAGDEVWGDWLARITDAPSDLGLKAATIERLSGSGLPTVPYTIFLVPRHPPLLADMLFVDDLGWLRDYARTGEMPAGLHRAPMGVERRICPEIP